jgi:hypothetical protein
MTSTIRTAIATTLSVGLLGSGLALAPSALASHGGGSGVRASGTCTDRGHWKLKANADDGRLEVEADVDVNKAGQDWRWRILDSGTVVRHGTATTTAPSGSFSVSRKIANRAGTHRIAFRATNPKTGNACHGSVSG